VRHPPSPSPFHADIFRGIQTDIDLDDLSKPEVAEVIPELLTEYSAECRDWTTIAGEHWKMSRWEYAQELLETAIKQFGGGVGRPPDLLALVRLHSMLAHFRLSRARVAPRVILPHASKLFLR
jgi:RNA polymerase-associated protein CTR9